MSNFKFNCPHCGQKILGDSNYSGTEITCPSCKKPMTVPHRDSPTTNPNIPHSSASTMPLPTVGPRPAGPARLSRLAVASLICSMLAPVGSIPGIICGHLALARIRGGQTLKGAGFARAGLILGYVGLVVGVVYAVVKYVF